MGKRGRGGTGKEGSGKWVGRGRRGWERGKWMATTLNSVASAEPTLVLLCILKAPWDREAGEGGNGERRQWEVGWTGDEQMLMNIGQYGRKHGLC